MACEIARCRRSLPLDPPAGIPTTDPPTHLADHSCGLAGNRDGFLQLRCRGQEDVGANALEQKFADCGPIVASHICGQDCNVLRWVSPGGGAGVG